MFVEKLLFNSSTKIIFIISSRTILDNVDDGNTPKNFFLYLITGKAEFTSLMN